MIFKKIILFVFNPVPFYEYYYEKQKGPVTS